MDKSLHLAAVFRLDGHDIAPVSLGYDILLHELRIVRRVGHLVELVANFRLLHTNLAPYFKELGRGAVRNLLLGDYGRGYLSFEIFVRLKRREKRVENGLDSRVRAAPLSESAHGSEHLGNIEQFAHGERAARAGSRCGVIDIAKPAEGRTAEASKEHMRVARLIHLHLREINIALRAEAQRKLARVGACRELCEALQYFIKFQSR